MSGQGQYNHINMSIYQHINNQQINKYNQQIQVMWGQGQLPPGSVPMWGPGMPGETFNRKYNFLGGF